MNPALTEIKACLASLDQMINRTKLLSDEYDKRVRSVDIKYAPPVSSLKHAIYFPEVRSLDLLCKDALQRRLPDYPQLTNEWRVYGFTGTDSPDEVLSNLVNKRTILQQALNLLEASQQSESGTGILPKDYQKLTDAVSAFFSDDSHDCHNYEKNVFIMTRFIPGNETLEQIDSCIRKNLRNRGLIGHRADDRCYPKDRNLWDNVCTYMFCCKYGVAVLENILTDEFNPNVALEYGFIRALGKPSLLLKEICLKPRADILGTLWEEFDILNIEKTVSSSISNWLDDIGI